LPGRRRPAHHRRAACHPSARRGVGAGENKKGGGDGGLLGLAIVEAFQAIMGAVEKLRGVPGETIFDMMHVYVAQSATFLLSEHEHRECGSQN